MWTSSLVKQCRHTLVPLPSSAALTPSSKVAAPGELESPSCSKLPTASARASVESIGWAGQDQGGASPLALSQTERRPEVPRLELSGLQGDQGAQVPRLPLGKLAPAASRGAAASGVLSTGNWQLRASCLLPGSPVAHPVPRLSSPLPVQAPQTRQTLWMIWTRIWITLSSPPPLPARP